MPPDEKSSGAFQPIEQRIIEEFRADPHVLDSDALAAVEALIRYYELGDLNSRLGKRARRVFDSLRETITWNLDPQDGGLPPATIADIIASLKRLVKSISYWSGERGGQGYLTFVSEHLGSGASDSLS